MRFGRTRFETSSERKGETKQSETKRGLTGLIATSVSVLFLFPAAIGAAQTTTQFATGANAPKNGVVLTGTAVNAANGQPVRHLWFSDSVHGFCRVDPDIDSVGPYSINLATCISNVAGGNTFSPGGSAFDSAGNLLYIADLGKLGVVRLNFLPDGDNGNGSIATANQEVLGGVAANGGTSAGCGIPTNGPNSVALGPDGNLYVGFTHTGNIMRINSPQTESLPCSNVQAQVISTPDLKRDTGLAWVGHSLFGNDTHGPWGQDNADQCSTPQNNFSACRVPFNAFGGQVVSPSEVVSDQFYPAIGSSLFFASSSSVTQVKNVASSPTITQNFGGTGFQFISGLALDTTNTTTQVLYVGDDPSNGVSADQGRWFQVSSANTPGPPSAPASVSASASDSQAIVKWVAPAGQPVTSYTVHPSTVVNGAVPADVVVQSTVGSSAPPTSATITGLTNGGSYQFEVLATNAQGSSAFSIPSNTVIPQAISVPAAPTGVVASEGNSSASVAWTAPANNGGSAITSYTISAVSGGRATGLTATVSGTATGAVVSGLSNGVVYTFTVHATNSVGNSAESAQSNAVTPAAPTGTVPGAPSGVRATAGNASASVTWTPPANNGGTALTGYTVTALVNGAPSGVSASAAGTSSGVVVAGLTNGVTYTFTVHATNATGNGPESASSAAVTPSAPVNPPGTATDLQVVGSASNGGPAVNTSDTFTWQIRNNQNAGATAVHFSESLPSSLRFSSVSSPTASCAGPAPGTLGGTVNCSADALLGGQSFIVTVNVTLPTAGSSATTGSVSFSGLDSNPSNNSFTVVIGVR